MAEFVRIRLVPAQSDPSAVPGHRPAEDFHLRACLDHRDDRAWWASADVLYSERPATIGALLGWLHDFPGAAVCAAPTTTGHIFAVVRPNTQVVTTQSSGNCADSAAQRSALLGSVMHAGLVAGLFPATAWTTERSGVVSLRLRVLPVSQVGARTGSCHGSGVDFGNSSDNPATLRAVPG